MKYFGQSVKNLLLISILQLAQTCIFHNFSYVGVPLSIVKALVVLGAELHRGSVSGSAVEVIF